MSTIHHKIARISKKKVTAMLKINLITQKKEDKNESKFYASIKDCHALVDGTYLIDYNNADIRVVDGVEDRPFVTESHHKNHIFKNGDFIIVKNAPYLPVFPLSKGKTVTTRKMMFMYWKDAASNEGEEAKDGADEAKDGAEEAKDGADENATKRPMGRHMESPRQTLLPFEDSDEDFSYNVPACWREVPINVDAWLKTDYEKYKGQEALYEFKFITQLEVKIPNHATLAKINEESGKNQDDPDNEKTSSTP